MLHSPDSHHRQERLVFALGIVTGCYNGELLENVEPPNYGFLFAESP